MTSVRSCENSLSIDPCCRAPAVKAPAVISQCWRWGVRLLNKHTDLISTVAILAITTCLTVDKIFRNSLPNLVPRLALVVFNFGGIIWLNIQVRDLLKSCRDVQRTFQSAERVAMLEAAIKVLFKSVNIILTCATFAAAVIAAVGFPNITLSIYLAMRPLGMSALALTIGSDIRDYFVNESVLQEMEKVESDPKASERISKIMIFFLEGIQRSSKSLFSAGQQEKKIADRLIQQLDIFTLETFQERLLKIRSVLDVRIEALKLFYGLKDSMSNKQVSTKANLSLIALGYASMGLCRAFPNTVVEWTTRLGMSILYTDELIRQKLFQADLAEVI